MHSAWLQVITLIALFLLANLLFLTLQVATLRALRFEIEEVVFGFGPRLWGASHAGVEYVLKGIPLSSYVRPEGGLEGAFGQASLRRRMAVLVLPWLAMLACCALVLGIDGLITSVASAWPQVLSGVYPRFGGGAPLIERLFVVLEAAPARATALFLVKLALFNLLPLPSLAGGNVLVALLPSERVRQLLMTLGFVASALVFWTGWLLSFYRFFAA